MTGIVTVDCKNDSKHEGLLLSVDATVNMQLSSKNVGLFEAFYNSARVSFVLNGVLSVPNVIKFFFILLCIAYSVDQCGCRDCKKWQIFCWSYGDSIRSTA